MFYHRVFFFSFCIDMHEMMGQECDKDHVLAFPGRFSVMGFQEKVTR